MTITTLHVERRKSDGNYGNRALALTAELEAGEDAQACLGALMARCEEGIAQAEAAERERRQAAFKAQMTPYVAGHGADLPDDGGAEWPEPGEEPDDEDDDWDEDDDE